MAICLLVQLVCVNKDKLFRGKKKILGIFVTFSVVLLICQKRVTLILMFVWGLKSCLYFIYNSGSQPGVRVSQVVREKYQEVRQIFFSVICDIKLYEKNYSLGVREFLFLFYGVREQKLVGNRWSATINVTYFRRYSYY